MLTPLLHKGKPKVRSIAVLTSGGDAPGMNAAIRAVVRTSIAHGVEVHGVYKGYSGLLEGRIQKLNVGSVANIIQRGGTILKTDRCPAFFEKAARREAANLMRRQGIESLIVVGGDGSYKGAHLLETENGFPVVGIPGTIDNDIPGTEDTIGFDTAVNTAIEAIDRIRDTANSHDRVFIVEVMGRSSGHIALQVGIGGGAERIIVPEIPESGQGISKGVERGIKRGKTSSIIVVAEGPKPGLALRVAKQLEKGGHSAKVCILGHIQRGGTPTAHDRNLASVVATSAVHTLFSGKSNVAIGVLNGQVVKVPLAEVVRHRRPLPEGLMAMAGDLAI